MLVHPLVAGWDRLLGGASDARLSQRKQSRQKAHRLMLEALRGVVDDGSAFATHCKEKLAVVEADGGAALEWANDAEFAKLEAPQPVPSSAGSDSSAAGDGAGDA